MMWVGLVQPVMCSESSTVSIGGPWKVEADAASGGNRAVAQGDRFGLIEAPMNSKINSALAVLILGL